KEVKLQELSAKRDNKRKVLLLKENLKESIQNNKKLIVEAKFKAKNDLLLQKNDLKNSRNSKRLERQQQRESNLKKAKNEKQNKINQKREIIEAYKIKKLKFKSGIIASRKKDSIKINTLTKDVKHQEYIISKQKNKLHDEILDISKKSKQNIENIEDKYELKNISFDVRHEENIEKSKINNVNISIVQMFGKQTMKKVSKAEEAAIELHAKKYSQAERLEIENFREIVEAEEPVHIKSLIKYVFVLKKLNLSKEKIHELYINQLCSLLFGETIQFGSGYLRIAKKKNNKTLFSENLKYGKNKEVFTIFPKQGNKEFNKLVSEKLNNGSVIKIASGLLVYKNKKTIKVLADTNYKGA
ncbi:MAG: hypothetical protein KAG14_02315, partial [Mycoplasmataceae bacterium]|nr:hypothetical protein [Mycoplasmataceae bacterium]